MTPAASLLSRRLHFRILAPIIPIVLLMLAMGSAIFSLGMQTISQYANERIKEDLERNSHQAYSICDGALQSLLTAGNENFATRATIRKGLTLGKLEDYAREYDLQIVVYSGDDEDKRLLLEKTSLDVAEAIRHVGSNSEVVKISKSGSDYYARGFDFELWDWHIILIKDGKFYADFASKVSQSYYAIGAILILTCLMLVLYFRRMINGPIQAIIKSIQLDGMPDYKGIYEFEFLSNVIRQSRQEEQQKQLQMSHQAAHDALTGLFNRREFEHRLENLLSRMPAQPQLHTVLYLDLDQFKIINDSCGHNAGDALLRQLTGLLQEKLRQSDVLARLGGDEFGVLLENCAGESAFRVADGLRQTIRSFHFVWRDKSFAVGVSIGLVTFGDDGLTLNDILSFADGACYVAKDKGRNRIHVYHPNDHELKERKGQMNWVGRITAGLEENRMVLYKQAIFPLQHNIGQPKRFEVLMRMLDEDGNLVPPMSFIPAAERYNLMPAIDFWVIKTSFEYCMNYCSKLSENYVCFINLSGPTLGDERLLQHIKEQFAQTRISPSSICFEITETAAIANLNIAAALIKDLKQMGCCFALDDFGSGMSSFGYLKNLPVDFIKIDGSFVSAMLNDPTDRAMVEAINTIGHVMGIQTIAEFVESDEVKNELTAIGVDFAQGFGLGRPEPMRISQT